jgi:hypothetical protein
MSERDESVTCQKMLSLGQPNLLHAMKLESKKKPNVYNEENENVLNQQSHLAGINRTVEA